MRQRFVIAFCLGIFCLLGCGKVSQDPKTLVVWHWMVDRHEAFEVLAQKYHQETGVAVNFNLFFPSDIYSQKIVASAQAKILPDIYGILDTKSTFAEFIKGGYVADLTADFQKDNGTWQESIFPRALGVNRFEAEDAYGIKPGIYGVPLDVMNIQMVYNKSLLAKAGVEELPQTFDEFIDVARILNRQGIQALVSGWGELWLINCFAFNYAFNILGEEKIMATYRGEVPYTDPDWIRVFGIFDTLAKNNALAVGIVTKSNKFAEQDFALGRAAFAFNGSWCVNVYHDMNPHLDYGVMLLPPISDAHPLRIWGGAGSSFVVNKNSPNKKAAIAFLRWLSDKDQQVFLSKETRNLPSNRYALAEIPEVLIDFASAMDVSTHPKLWPLDEDELVKEKFNRGLQSIIIGEKTPRQVAEEVQRVKEQRMARKKRRK